MRISISLASVHLTSDPRIAYIIMCFASPAAWAGADLINFIWYRRLEKDMLSGNFIQKILS